MATSRSAHASGSESRKSRTKYFQLDDDVVATEAADGLSHGRGIGQPELVPHSSRSPRRTRYFCMTDDEAESGKTGVSKRTGAEPEEEVSHSTESWLLEKEELEASKASFEKTVQHQEQVDKSVEELLQRLQNLPSPKNTPPDTQQSRSGSRESSCSASSTGDLRQQKTPKHSGDETEEDMEVDSSSVAESELVMGGKLPQRRAAIEQLLRAGVNLYPADADSREQRPASPRQQPLCEKAHVQATEGTKRAGATRSSSAADLSPRRERSARMPEAPSAQRASALLPERAMGSPRCAMGSPRYPSPHVEHTMGSPRNVSSHALGSSCRTIPHEEHARGRPHAAFSHVAHDLGSPRSGSPQAMSSPRCPSPHVEHVSGGRADDAYPHMVREMSNRRRASPHEEHDYAYPQMVREMSSPRRASPHEEDDYAYPQMVREMSSPRRASPHVEYVDSAYPHIVREMSSPRRASPHVEYVDSAYPHMVREMSSPRRAAPHVEYALGSHRGVSPHSLHSGASPRARDSVQARGPGLNAKLRALDSTASPSAKLRASGSTASPSASFATEVLHASRQMSQAEMRHLQPIRQRSPSVTSQQSQFAIESDSSRAWVPGSNWAPLAPTSSSRQHRFEHGMQDELFDCHDPLAHLDVPRGRGGEIDTYPTRHVQQSRSHQASFAERLQQPDDVERTHGRRFSDREGLDSREAYQRDPFQGRMTSARDVRGQGSSPRQSPGHSPGQSPRHSPRLTPRQDARQSQADCSLLSLERAFSLNWYGWSVQACDDGKLFYYHEPTNVSQWEIPEALYDVLGQWMEVIDDDNNTYWWNDLLGMSSWKDPRVIVDIFQAALEGDMFFLQLYVHAGGLLDVSDSCGCTALHYACASNSEQVVARLLRHGACPSVVDLGNSTPLHTACRYGNAAAVRLLLEAHADPDLRDSQGDTPMHLAAELGCVNALNWLVMSWASPMHRSWNRGSRTPAEVAAGSGHDGAAALLRQYEMEPYWFNHVGNTQEPELGCQEPMDATPQLHQSQKVKARPAKVSTRPRRGGSRGAVSSIGGSPAANKENGGEPVSPVKVVVLAARPFIRGMQWLANHVVSVDDTRTRCWERGSGPPVLEGDRWQKVTEKFADFTTAAAGARRKEAPGLDCFERCGKPEDLLENKAGTCSA